MYKLGALSIVTGLIMFITAGIVIADGKLDQTEAVPEESGLASLGMLLPLMNPVKGRMLFASKGCVVCHSINGIGGEDAPPLDAETMPSVMNPFDFVAKMWRGARTMIEVQEEEIGEQIEFTGEELANIIAFVHDAEEQKKFSEADIPPSIADLMGHMGEESEEHEQVEHNE